MPEILPSSNLDSNKDQAIDTKELQVALDSNFFDKLSAQQKSQLEIELQQVDSLLEESFCKALTLAYLDANKRIGTRGNELIAIQPKDQRIVDLYLKLSQNSNWKYYVLTAAEEQELQQQDYKERREGKPYSTDRLKGKKREFEAHLVFKSGTHEQKAALLKSEVEKIIALKEPTPEQKEEWIGLLVEGLMFNDQGEPSIFALKDRAMGQREANSLLINSYQKQIQTDLASLKKMYEDLGQSTAMLEFADPKVFLMKKQLHFAQLAEKDFEKIIKLPDNEKGGSFASGWSTMKREEFLPFVGQANNRYKNSMTQKLAEWAAGGVNVNGGDLDRYAEVYGNIATAGQDSFLHAAQGFQALQQIDYGARHNIGKGVGNALPFLGEMFYLGPIFRQVGFAAETISTANKGTKIAMETANIISRGGVATAIDVPRVGNMTSERMLDGFGATFDQTGNIKFETIKEGEGFNEAFIKAFGSLWVEMSVEHGLYQAINGAKLAGFKGAELLTGKTIPPQIIAEGLMSRWLKRFASQFPTAKTAQELLTNVTNKYGVAKVKNLFQRNGVLNEYIEEEVSGRVGNIVTADRGDRNPFYMSTNRQIFETFMTTLIIGAGMKTMQPTRPNNLQDSDKSKDNALNDITDFEEVSSQPLPVEEVVNESKAGPTLPKDIEKAFYPRNLIDSDPEVVAKRLLDEVIIPLVNLGSVEKVKEIEAILLQRVGSRLLSGTGKSATDLFQEMTDQKFEDIAKRENRDLESTETKLAITNGILLLPRDNNEFIYTEILKLLDSPEYKTLREKIYIDRNLDGVSTHMIEGSERNLYSNFGFIAIRFTNSNEAIYIGAITIDNNVIESIADIEGHKEVLKELNSMNQVMNHDWYHNLTLLRNSGGDQEFIDSDNTRGTGTIQHAPELEYNAAKFHRDYWNEIFKLKPQLKEEMITKFLGYIEKVEVLAKQVQDTHTLKPEDVTKYLLSLYGYGFFRVIDYRSDPRLLDIVAQRPYIIDMKTIDDASEEHFQDQVHSNNYAYKTQSGEELTHKEVLDKARPRTPEETRLEEERRREYMNSEAYKIEQAFGEIFPSILDRQHDGIESATKLTNRLVEKGFSDYEHVLELLTRGGNNLDTTSLTIIQEKAPHLSLNFFEDFKDNYSATLRDLASYLNQGNSNNAIDITNYLDSNGFLNSSPSQMLHPQNQLENSKMDPLLEEVLSIQDVKPEGCSDQEFLDGVRPMGDYTNFTLMNPYLMFTHSGVENSYTSEAEFIAQMQQHFQTSEFAMLSYEEYKKQHIEKHYAGKPVKESTQKMFDFADKYPDYIEKINTLVDAMKNGQFTTIEEYLQVYNQLARFVDANKRPNENLRYHISLEEALATYNKGLNASKESTVTSTASEISKTISEPTSEKPSHKTVDNSNYPEISTYFEGKQTKFGFSEETVLGNNAIWDRPNGHDLVKKKIEFYAKDYAIDNNLQLTDAQINKIHEAHTLPGEIANLTLPELLAKLRVLDEAFANHPNKSDLARLCLEAGFCGFKGFAVKTVLKIKAWKERRTPMNAVYALQFFMVTRTIDQAQSDILHKLIDLGQTMSASLQQQSEKINKMGADFEADMTLKNDQYDEFTNNYDEMVTEYTNFLQLAKEYSDTRVGRGLNRRSDDKIDTAIAEAEGGKEVLEGGKMTLEETQQMVNQVNEFLVNLQQNTQTSLDIANTFQGAMENAHTYTDIILNTIQVITGLFLAYQMFYAYGLYHSKSTNPTEQKAMMKWFKFGVVTSALTVLTYYAAINPTIQEWVTELTNQIQGYIDTFEATVDKTVSSLPKSE